MTKASRSSKNICDFTLRFCIAILHCNFALQFCTAILHCNFALQFCTAILHCNFALQFCTAILHCNFALQFCIAILHCNFHCDFALRFCTAIAPKTSPVSMPLYRKFKLFRKSCRPSTCRWRHTISGLVRVLWPQFPPSCSDGSPVANVIKLFCVRNLLIFVLS